ncbi:hypothetical protein BDV95DRAFT_291757 [Massariosphaeria phaeospora]|uniref:DUF3500 domain-containing protein n=1 Tax=Massariosphaeria phaeospora TaxID=100035 RepID=A0A7C8M649_9PLEO|nr:hypothetical protein BDV95DRAFT_291757 [Massariosphaeria phaeospora]
MSSSAHQPTASASTSTSTSTFRAHLPSLTTPRFTTAAQQSPLEYAAFFRTHHAPPWLYNLTQTWETLYREPFHGLTSDGTVRPGLFEARDESVDIEGVVARAQDMLEALGEEGREKVAFGVGAREWRAWSNPEMLLRPLGVRLEDVPPSTTFSIHRLIAASLSPEGYAKAVSAMRINDFLGTLVSLPRILNQHSYNFLLFGTPSSSPSSPWGWLLYGHHLCLSVFFRGPQLVISPTFTGAEPNAIDAGEFAGTQILHRECELGLRLMQSLTPAQQKTAQVYEKMRDDRMRQTGDLLTDRWNQDDQRHLCGAFRDNRVVPSEGVCVSSLTSAQRSLVLDICAEFLLYLPTPSRHLKLDDIERHFAETYFCWIGGYGDDDAFYYRIQSPVIVCEFDHHSGVFLANEEPARFHTHTIVRTPNAGDYGQAIRGEGEKLE